MSESSWVINEFDGINFSDKRLNDRFFKLASNFAKNPSAPINQVSENWFDAKGTYRFFENDKVSCKNILGPHYKKTAERASHFPFILAVQDTTVFDYSRHQKTNGMGSIGGKPHATFGTHGMVMHSSYALSPDGLPLGVLSQEIWARKKVKNRSNHYDNRLIPIEEKEGYKWISSFEKSFENINNNTSIITICDRESDIFDFFLEVKELDSHFIVRANHNRNIGTRYDVIKMFDEIKNKKEFAPSFNVKVPIRGIEKEDKRKKGAYHQSLKYRNANVKIRSCKITLNPSRKFGQLIKEPINLSFIEVFEVDQPDNLRNVSWYILTSLDVNSFEEASRIVHFYSLRWRIENYFKILKSGCNVEKCRLGDGSKLKKYISIFSVIAWRIHWLTYFSRIMPDSPCDKVLTDVEWKTLYIKIKKTKLIPENIPTAEDVFMWLGGLGGHLNRKSDGPPGMISIWRGWIRLQDMVSIHELVK